MSRTEFTPEYVKQFKSSKDFIDHYRGLHKIPKDATIGEGKNKKAHPLAGLINENAASNRVSDEEMVEVYNSVHEPDESEVDHEAASMGKGN